MPRLARNRYLDAFLKLLLISAVAHFTVLALQVLVRGNIAPLNYFAVLGLPFFFPGVETGILSDALSFILITAIYILLFISSRKRSDKPQ